MSDLTPRVPSNEPDKSEVLINPTIYGLMRDMEATINTRNRPVECIHIAGDSNTGKAYGIIVYANNIQNTIPDENGTGNSK